MGTRLSAILNSVRYMVTLELPAESEDEETVIEVERAVGDLLRVGDYLRTIALGKREISILVRQIGLCHPLPDGEFRIKRIERVWPIHEA